LADLADTIFAHSSGRPPAAIAVIRISGSHAHAAARELAGELPEPRHAALRTLRRPDGELLDRALVIRFDGPASVTGEDLVELHCHGGRAVVDGVLAALGEVTGLRQAEAGEFTRRALVNGRLDLTEAEGLADLLEAETQQQRRAALAVAGGALRNQIENWRSRLVHLSAQAEAAIDYVGDEDETALDTHAVRSAAAALVGEWRNWLERPPAELLHQGVRVVLAGPPNTGKSSLLNALVGHDRAIVTDLAGTTRDIIEVPLALEGIPLVLVDTAGLREATNKVERLGISLAEEQIARADVLLWLGDAAECPSHANVIQVHTKVDLIPPESGKRAVSVVTGEGLADLRAALLGTARLILPNEDELVLNRRQSAALGEAAHALSGMPQDLLLVAESLREARSALDRLTGRAGIEDVLDGLFSRFCLGK